MPRKNKSIPPIVTPPIVITPPRANPMKYEAVIALANAMKATAEACLRVQSDQAIINVSNCHFVASNSPGISIAESK